MASHRIPHQAFSDAKDDVTRRLISRFKTLISEGVLVAGARLPPERELARRFGVSRTSLRQALKVLEMIGVIRQRVGDGTYFRTSPTAILGEPMDFLVRLGAICGHELFELRLLVESALAARAAERATAQDLAEMRQQIRAMKASISNRRKFSSTMSSFMT